MTRTMLQPMTIIGINPSTKERTTHTFEVEDVITTVTGAVTIPLLSLRVVNTFSHNKRRATMDTIERDYVAAVIEDMFVRGYTLA